MLHLPRCNLPKRHYIQGFICYLRVKFSSNSGFEIANFLDMIHGLLTHLHRQTLFLESKSPFGGKGANQDLKGKNTMRTMKIFTVVLLWAGLAGAQASRTWVSGVGDDANPCSRTAPCKTFAGAISKTAAGGEIDALDPAGFGALTITKAITIDGGGGQVASVLVSGTNGIVVQAGPSDVVILRNIRFNGIGTGINGIRWLSGKALTVENCDIFGFTTNGIDIAKADGGKAFIHNTVIQNVGGAGVSVQSSTTNTSVDIDTSRFDLAGTFGVIAGSFSRITVSKSVASGNGSAGFIASASAGTAELNVTDSTSSNNVTGVQAGGGTAAATVRLSNVTLHDNLNGMLTAANGTLKSFGNNFNSGSGAPTAPNLPLQ